MKIQKIYFKLIKMEDVPIGGNKITRGLIYHRKSKKYKQMKTRSILGMMLALTQISFAQQNKLALSIGAGPSNSSSTNKTSLIGNGFNVQADVFVPFYNKGDQFKLGINVLGNYGQVKNLAPDNSAIENLYQIYGGTLAVDAEVDSKTAKSFSGLIGLQGSIALGKLSVSPSLNAGYLNFEKSGYVQKGSTSINGQLQQVDLVKSEQGKSNGFVFKPQVKMAYNLTPNLSVFASPAMTIGHELTHTVQQRVPQGGFNDRNRYEPSQIAKGTWENKSYTSNYNLTEVNLGVSFALGKNKTKKPKTGLGSGPHAAAASYARVSATPTGEKEVNNSAEVKADQATLNPLYQGQGEHGVNPMHNEKLATTNPAIDSEHSPQQRPGSPIGGIVVKGGKNPGGNMNLISNSNGEVSLNNLEKGEYLFQLSETKTAGKSISEKGIKRVENAAMAKPGNPIGGIIVKGGKNPGGSFMVLTVNDKGQIGFEVVEAGNYKLTFETSGASTPKTDESSKKKKVVEKATSGLKDTLKTNV